MGEEGQTLNAKKAKGRRGVIVSEDGLVFGYTPPSGLDNLCCLFGRYEWKGPSAGSTLSEGGGAQGINYFEIFVEDVARDGVIAVGITTPKIVKKKLNILPGNRKGSYGFHSDGHVGLAGHSRSVLGRVWGRGDTVGFGVDMLNSRDCFVTINGKLVENFSSGSLCRLPDKYKAMLPAIGVSASCKVKVNFSGPFMYNLSTLPLPQRIRPKYVTKLNHTTVELLNDSSSLILFVDTKSDREQKKDLKRILKKVATMNRGIKVFVCNSVGISQHMQEFFGVLTSRHPFVVHYQLPDNTVHILAEDVAVNEHSLTEFINGFHVIMPSHEQAPYKSHGVTVIAFSDRWVTLQKGGANIRPLFITAHQHRLSLKGRKIQSFPAELWEQIRSEGRVMHLDLSRNDINFLAPELGYVSPQLHKLALAKNQIAEIPSGFLHQMTNLTKLNLRANQLAALSSEVGSLTDLVVLNLLGNKLEVLPLEIGNLRKLKALNLRANQLSRLPSEIGNLTALTQLGVCGNRLRKLPSNIGELGQLRTLDLDRNLLKHLPPEIGRLGCLSQMMLGNNQIADVPPELGKLTALTHLDLSNNKLKNLPAEIGGMTNLTFLHLSRNKLACLPPEVGKLANLGHLELSDNKLRNLPYDMWNLDKLEEAFFNNNPFEVKGSSPELTELVQGSIEFFTIDTLMLLVGSEMRDDFKWMIKPNQITKHKLIGSGKFGNVYKGEYDGRPCAVKFFIEKDEMNWIKFCQELGVILHLKRKNLHSPFLADVYGAYISREEPFIVMELGECSLYDLIYFPPDNFQWNLKVKIEVLRAVAVCLDALAKGDGGGNGICHGDLHAKNILVMKKEPLTLKIADWGLSKSITTFMVLDTKNTSQRLTTSLYTPAVAPELYEGEWTMSADIFSYAILCYQVLTQEPLFSGMTETEIRRSIKNGERPSLNSIAEARLRRMINRCWGENDDRPSPVKIIRKLDRLLNSGGVFCTVTVAKSASPQMKTAQKPEERRERGSTGRERGLRRERKPGRERRSRGKKEEEEEEERAGGGVRELVLPCPKDEVESMQFVKRLKGLAWPTRKRKEGEEEEEKSIMLLVDGEDIDESLFEMLHELVKPRSVIHVLPSSS